MRFIPIYAVSKDVGDPMVWFFGEGDSKSRGGSGDGEKVTYVYISRRGFG